MRIDADTVKLNVVDTGAGEPALVFLHYWGGTARTWHQVTRRLEHSYRCIAYDQRGWGTSDASATGYELDDLARDLSALIARLNLSRYVLIGHSMGGKVAMLEASRRRPGLEALVLVAPASPFPQNIPEEARVAQRHAYDNRQTALAAVRFLTFRKPEDAMTEQLVEDSLRGSPEAKRTWPASAAYEDISPAVRKIAVPTLVLVGDHDPQDPEEQHRREVLPLINDARLRTLPGCGHLSPIEQPVLLAHAINAFLQGTIRPYEHAYGR